jgi:hypothetical protein
VVGSSGACPFPADDPRVVPYALRVRTQALLTLLVCAGCVGVLGDSTPGGDDPPPPEGTDPGDPRLLARAWRLTPAQYEAEVQRLFPGAPTVNLPEGASEFGLTNISDTARIDQGNASQFNDAARTIGTWAGEQGASAARCTSFGTSACIDEVLAWLPEAAFRRPPTTEEIAELRGVYDDTVTFGEEWAFSALVRAVLLSPQFLYRQEIGPDGDGVVEIDDFEIASLMAFSLTDVGPDDELLAAAKAGTLTDPDVREDHARRLMDKSTRIWQRFFWEWLKMSTLASQGNETGLSPELVAALEDEYQTFVGTLVVEQRGSLEELLTTSNTWGTPEVAEYYGATHPGSGVAPIELDPLQRGGLLTLGAWLVAHGKDGRDNVFRRGMSIYRDAVCNDIKPLEIDLEAALKDLVGADATVKEIAEARAADATCGACHKTADPAGLVFENYEGDGRWHTVYDDGKPVEAAATLDGVTYANAPEFSRYLATDEHFQQCLVRRFGHFLLGAEFGSPLSVRAPKEAYDAFIESGGSFEELLVAIVRDPSFIERRKLP